MVRISAPLVYYDKVDGTYINVGTGSWQQWLNKNSSFRYESFWGSFTAYKEHEGTEIFWLAKRRVKEEPRSAYLGSNKDLLLEKLVDTAKQLNTSNTTYWESKSQIHTTSASNSSESDSLRISQEIETNAVRQWCIFYTHPDGRVEFMGGCWEKDQALTQIQSLKKQAYYSEPVSDATYVPSGTYDVREELVLPVGYPKKSYLRASSKAWQIQVAAIQA